MMQFQFDKIQSSTTELHEQTTRFVLKDLKLGRGLTIANALRRVLLTELEGTAITAVKINGINSPFSVIPGVREDILELILNLKQIKFRGLLNIPFFTTLKVEGPLIITANDIKLPDNLEVLNSNQYMATISDNISLEIQLKLESGIGYHNLDENSIDLPPGFFNIDSIFTPIKTVNFEIKESYRIGEQQTEILNLDILTNGSILPIEALNKAAKILEILFSSLIVNESDLNIPPKKENKLEILIEELDLSVRSYNCLKVANIKTFAELIQYSVKDLKKIKNLGKKSATEVVEKLQDRFGIILT